VFLIDFSDTLRYAIRNESVSGIQKVVYSTLGENVDVSPCVIDWDTGDVYVPRDFNLMNWDLFKSISYSKKFNDYKDLLIEFKDFFIKMEISNFKGNDLIFLGGPWNFSCAHSLINQFMRSNNVKIFVHDLIPFYENPENETSSYMFRNFFQNLDDGVLFATSNTQTLKDIDVYLHSAAKLIPFPRQLKIISGHWNYNAGMNNLEHDSYFLSLGSIDGRKDHSSIINYWIDSGLFDAYKLFVVGAMKIEDQSFTLAMNRATKNIHYLGVVDDVMNYRLMTSSKGIIYPTKTEGFGLPVLEGYVLGKKVYIPEDSNYKNSHCSYIEYSHDRMIDIDAVGWRGQSTYADSWKEFVNNLKEM